MMMRVIPSAVSSMRRPGLSKTGERKVHADRDAFGIVRYQYQTLRLLDAPRAYSTYITVPAIAGTAAQAAALP